MAVNPYIFCNRNGIPCIESQSVNLTDTGCTFQFKPHAFLNGPYMGLVAIKIAQSITAPTTAVPIYFTTVSANGASATNQLKVRQNGTAITTSTWQGTGVYLCFYDRTTDTLQLLA